MGHVQQHVTDDSVDPETRLLSYLRPILKAASISDDDIGHRIERIANLIRNNACQGIYPRWTLRYPPGLKPDAEQMVDIAEQIQEGFTSGDAPLPWRLDLED